MKATVFGLNKGSQRAAVFTEIGYVVFDILDGEVSIKDEISGALDEHGDQALVNLTTGDILNVCIQAIGATKENAAALLSQ